MLAARSSKVAATQRTQQQRAPGVARRQVTCRADAAPFLGSPTNIIMVASTASTLFAARFGLAPSVKKVASPLKLVDREVPQMTGDPAGFTAVDVLAMGTAGHGIGIGIVLGLKGIGAI